MQETLYKIDNNGKTREWSIEVKGHKYRTTYGEKGGQLVTTEWTECIGKNIGRSNETTPEDQAIIEAEAIVTKQQDKGYGKTAKRALGNVMLAKSYDDYEIDYPIWESIKYDGSRCVARTYGLFTRNHKEILSCPHIFEEIKPLLSKLPDGVCFDGELYNHDLKHDFNKIMSLVRKTKPTQDDLDESKEKIQYHIYDITDTNMKFSERYKLFSGLIKNLKYCKLVKSTLVGNQKELDSLYEQHLENGYEGQMIRLDEVYQEKRTKYLLKRKDFKDNEYRILNIGEGIGNRANMAGYMEFSTKNGSNFKANIKADWSVLKEYWQNRKKYIGKMATVKYFNLTPPPESVPRFGVVIKIDQEKNE